MPQTTFPAPVNDLATTLAGARTVGGSTLTLASGAGTKITTALGELGYGPPSSIKPLRVTVTKATYTGRGDITVVEATGLAGDVLNGCTVVEGTPDQAFAVGDLVEVDPTAGVIKAIEDAINALETATIDASAITTGTLAVARGGTGQSAYTDGQLLIGNTATGGLSKATLTQGANVTITNANGSITIAAASGGAPGGSAGQVQFNSSGAFGGDAGLTYDATTDSLSIVGGADGKRLILKAFSGQTTNILEVQNSAGTPTLTVNSGGSAALPNNSTVGGVVFANASIVNPGSGGNVQFGAANATPLTLTSYNSSGTNTVTILVTCSHAGENILTVRGVASQTGDLQRWQDSTPTTRLAVDKAGRLVSGAAAPSIAAGTGAGTGPTISVSGTDQGGVISITTGTAPATSATLATVTFSVAYGASPKAVLIAPAEVNSAALVVAARPYEDQASRAAASFVLKTGSTALAASTAYKWNYLVLG
jgi:hypothetical protein